MSEVEPRITLASATPCVPEMGGCGASRNNEMSLAV